MKEVFLNALKTKKILTVTFTSKEKGTITRKCIPFDFGPSRKYRDNLDRYHFYDLDSPDGQHNLSITPNQIINITSSDENFEPKDYVKWTPNWHIERNWGNYS
jgi:hypothetical protein